MTLDEFNNWKKRIDRDKFSCVLIATENAYAFSCCKNYLISLGYESVGDLKTQIKEWESYTSNFFESECKSGGGKEVVFYQEFFKK